MALVHDLAEATVGDITPHCNVPKEEKYAMEKKALHDIVSLVDDVTVREEMINLWEEYEAGNQPQPESHV